MHDDQPSARRVPASVAHLNPGKSTVVKQSTKIRIADDPRGSKARKVADRINEQIEAYRLGEGQAAEANADSMRLGSALALSASTIQTADLAKAPIVDIVDRLQFVRCNESDETVAAVLGTERPPDIMLEGRHAEYEALTAASRRDFSPDQIRLWRNPRLRAVANLIAVIGNKPIAAVTRDDAIEFQEWWAARLIADDLDVGTANRDIGVINKVLNTRRTAGRGKPHTRARLRSAVA